MSVCWKCQNTWVVVESYVSGRQQSLALYSCCGFVLHIYHSLPTIRLPLLWTANSVAPLNLVAIFCVCQLSFINCSRTTQIYRVSKTGLGISSLSYRHAPVSRAPVQCRCYAGTKADKSRIGHQRPANRRVEMPRDLSQSQSRIFAARIKTSIKENVSSGIMMMSSRVWTYHHVFTMPSSFASSTNSLSCDDVIWI